MFVVRTWEGAATDKLQVAACVCCLLTPPGLCDSKLASLSPRLGNSFRNSRTKGRHSWGHQQRDYCQKFMYTKPEDPHYKSETMQMVWARWRSGDLVIHHITLLSLSLSVCLTLSGWGGGQVSRPCFVIDGRVGIQKIGRGILHPQPGWGRNNYNLGAEANGPGQWLSSCYAALGTCPAVTRGTSWSQPEERKLVISIWPSDFAWLLSTAQSAQCKITRRPSVSSEEASEEWTLHYDWDWEDWVWHGKDQSRGTIFIDWSDF